MPTRSLAVVAFALLLAVPVAGGGPACAEEAPADLARLAATFDGARLGPRVGPLTSLAVGRGEIRPLEPGNVRALVADGRVCGLLIGGKAVFRYTIDDRFSLSLARHNLKAAGLSVGLEATQVPATFELTLEAAAIWGIDLIPAAAPAPGATATPAPPADSPGITATDALPGWLTRALENRLDGNPGRDLALSVANGQPGYRWALLHRAGDDLVLDVDPRPLARAESLLGVWNLPTTVGALAGRWVQESLVVQPIGRAWWEPTPFNLAVVDTEIALTNPKGEQVQVTTRSRVQAQVDGLRLLPFSLLRGIWDSRDAFKPYTVTRVTLDGQPAPFSHQHGSLLVAPPRPLKKGDLVQLEVVAEGEILDRPAGDSFWWLGLESWYPRPAAGGFEWSEIRVSAEAAKPFLPFASGEVLKRETTAVGTRVETRLARPMERATVLAGKYKTVTEEQNGARVHVSTYATVKEDEARRIGKLVFGMRGCYERWLGVPYPFQDLQVIEINDWGWGQAPAGMIFITKEAFFTRARAQADEDEGWIAGIASRGINERIAHEVAHGWFPHVAKILRNEEDWLSESLSEYASAVCLQSVTADPRQGKQVFERQLREWKSMDKEVKPGASVYLAALLNSSHGESDSHDYLLYGRGPLVLHAIRQELRRQKGDAEGDRLFLTWIRSYVKSFTNRVAETRHLVAILDQVSGQPWQPFFERYVYGPESPPVK